MRLFKPLTLLAALFAGLCAVVLSAQSNASRVNKPRIVVLISEPEYKTADSLPPFIDEHLREHYDVTTLHAPPTGDVRRFGDFSPINHADLLIVSVRRISLPPSQMTYLRNYIKSGKPLLGIRTASHAFHIKKGHVPPGDEQWPEFDHEILGGNYGGHFGANIVTQLTSEVPNHPVLEGIELPFTSVSKLYRNRPLQPGAVSILDGTIPDQPAHSVAFSFKRADGGMSFYTSLGGVEDFRDPKYRMLLTNAVKWLLSEPPAKPRKTKIVKLWMREGLRFDPARFKANPGETIIIRLENSDATDMPHNFLLLKPGTREAIVSQALGLGDLGPTQHYVPTSDDIIASTPVIPVDGFTEFRVTLPDQPGIYPYVCTFPGHGVMMYGAAYVGVSQPRAENDPNIPQQQEMFGAPGGGRRPFVQRMFMPAAGPASIAVALPREQNLCWDATDCRLRYAWSGEFINANDHWTSKGQPTAAIPAPPWWRAVAGQGLRLKQNPDATRKFLGYRTQADGPEFHYQVGDLEVFESVATTSNNRIQLSFRIPQSNRDIVFPIPANQRDCWVSSAGTWQDGQLVIAAGDAREFTLQLIPEVCAP
jgi:azurin